MRIFSLVLPILLLTVVGCKKQTLPVQLQPTPEVVTHTSEKLITVQDPNQQNYETLLNQLTNISAGELTLEVVATASANNINYAYGTLDHTYPKTVEGIIWIANELNDSNWNLLYQGAAEVPCSVVDEHTVPADLITSCVATPSGEVISRN